MAESVLFQPSDQAERDRILTDLDITLFVEAGAGTGKTSSLVGRIVRLVAAGRAEMRRIAAITFTEKAAAELRDRVREKMEKAARDGSLPAAELARIERALPDIDAAAIETLHGFAQRILTTYPLEAGLPPAVSVQDEIVSSIAFDARWRDYQDGLLADASLEEALLRGHILGLDLRHLRELALVLHRNWDRIEDADLTAAELPPVEAQPLIAALDRACNSASACIEPNDLLLDHLRRVDAYRKRLATAEDGLDLLRIAAEKNLKLEKKLGRRDNWTSVRVEDVRGYLAEAETLRQALLDSQRAAVLATLLVDLRRFVLDYAGERQRDGRLEFHDLLVLARDLLRRDPSVRKALRAQFSHLLIDEFQDTDPIQIEIAMLLACGDDATPDCWEEAEVEEGRLFFVGDPKQSIYRFRRADIALYGRVRDRFGDRTVHLTQNFRSRPPVIDWVNAVFGALIGDGDDDGQAPYVALDAARASEDGTPLRASASVRVIGEASDENVDQIRRREMQEIAAVIRSAKAEGWLVADEDGCRPARYADIAILMPTRTGQGVLERALDEAGVPYRVESRDLLYDTQEVRDLLTILRSIDDPTDEVALVASLRTLAFGCGDDDLLRFSQAGGRWDYRQPPPSTLDAADPVVAAMAALKGLHERRWWQPLNEIVESVIRERRLFELAFAHRRPRERWQRLRFVLDQSRAFVEAGGATLRQFVEWAEMQAEEGTRVVETVVPEADDDAVRVLTIHAAKGLEFPIVILAGLNSTATGGRRGPKVLWGPDGRPEVQIGSFQTAGFADIDAVEKRMAEHEEVRLLYVAATRARDHLVLSLHHKVDDDCSASRIMTLCAEIPDLWERTQLVALPPEPTVDGHVYDFDDSPEKRERWLAERASRIGLLAKAPVFAATAIARMTAADPNLGKDAPVEETPPWRRGRAGTALGRAVHAVLQSIDLATGEGLAGAVAAQAAAEGITDHAAEIQGLVRAALDSDAVRAAVASGRYWREVYVAAPVDGAVVEGFIDLLYETPDGLVVVDYKTDRLPDDTDIDAALGRYRLQGAAYALALAETLGRPIAACRFVFVASPHSQERDVENLAAVVEEVRLLIRDEQTNRGG